MQRYQDLPMQPIFLFYLGLMIKSPTSGSLFSTSSMAQLETNETLLFDLIFLSWFSFILYYTDQQDY
jgi:hypothetical protein